MNSPPTDHKTKRFPLWVSVTLGAGCFAGLCTLFSLVVTIGVAWQEHSRAHWPEATASIQQCGVKSVKSTGQESTYYGIDCWISYRVNDQIVTSRVLSQSVAAPEFKWEFHAGQTQRIIDEMQQWVDAHPSGTLINVHYNPSSYGKAALVTTDMPRGGPQTGKNVKLTEGLAAICIALLVIGAIARRLSAAPDGQPS